MHIGIDFDNTIVSYDGLFHRVCREKGLIPAHLPVSKSEVRNYLRQAGREEDWTAIQGYVYGARMAEAEPYPGVREFFGDCRKAGVEVSIISHKTLRPYRGETYDLHQAALGWLELQGFFDPLRLGLTRDQVCFELTKIAKLERICARGCSHFVDDLPEFLHENTFPSTAQRILFDPHDHYSGERDFPRCQTWGEIRSLFGF